LVNLEESAALADPVVTAAAVLGAHLHGRVFSIAHPGPGKEEEEGMAG